MAIKPLYFQELQISRVHIFWDFGSDISVL